MTKRHSALTYTPLNIQMVRHHGPTDPDDTTLGLSLHLSPVAARANVVTTARRSGGGGGIMMNSARKRKGYAKSVSERKERRRERRNNPSLSYFRRSKKDGMLIEIMAEEEMNKENVVPNGKNSRWRAAGGGAIDSDDEAISSPEMEFDMETTTKKPKEAMEFDEESWDGDDFGAATEFQVEDENYENTAMSDESNDDSDESSLEQKRLFLSTTKKTTAKKRRVIPDEEEDSSEDEFMMKDTSRNSNSTGGKQGRSKTDSFVSKRGSILGDDSSDDEDGFPKTDSNKCGNDGKASRRRLSKRLEKTEDTFSIISSMKKGNLDVDSSDEDEGSENEFRLTSTSTKEKDASRFANKRGRRKKKNIIDDDSSCDENESMDISTKRKKSTSKKVSTTKKRGKGKATDVGIDDNKKNKANINLSKNKYAKEVFKPMPFARSSSSVNSFVKAAAAKLALAEASEANEEKKANNTSRKKQKVHKKKKKKKKEDEFDFDEDEESTVVDSDNDDDASEYQPTQGEGKLEVTKDAARSPRPTRRSSSRTKRVKNTPQDQPPIAQDQAVSTTIGKLGPRRRKKSVGKAKGVEGLELDDNEAVFTEVTGVDRTSTKDARNKKPQTPSHVMRKSLGQDLGDEESGKICTVMASSRRTKSTRSFTRGNSKHDKNFDLDDDGMSHGQEHDEVYATKSLGKKVKPPKSNEDCKKKSRESKDDCSKKINDIANDASCADSLEIDDDYDDMNESLYNHSMLPFTQAASQFMEQSMGSSTAEGARGNQPSIKESNKYATRNNTKLESIELSTRATSNMQVASQFTEQSVRNNTKCDALSVIESKDLTPGIDRTPDDSSIGSWAPSETATAVEETKSRSKNGDFRTSIELSTRGISKMGPDASLDAAQTQPQIHDRSQQSSAVSPEAKASVIVDSLSGEKSNQDSSDESEEDDDRTVPFEGKMEGSITNSAKQESQNDLIESSDAMRQEMKRLGYHVAEVRKIWRKLSTQFPCNLSD